jgi:hypothetical protein
MAYIVILALLLALSTANTEYDEEQMYRYLYASAYSYCESLDTGDCKQASQLIESVGLVPV